MRLRHRYRITDTVMVKFDSGWHEGVITKIYPPPTPTDVYKVYFDDLGVTLQCAESEMVTDYLDDLEDL